jgi:hypothetical protein
MDSHHLIKKELQSVDEQSRSIMNAVNLTSNDDTPVGNEWTYRSHDGYVGMEYFTNGDFFVLSERNSENSIQNVAHDKRSIDGPSSTVEMVFNYV